MGKRKFANRFFNGGQGKKKEPSFEEKIKSPYDNEITIPEGYGIDEYLDTDWTVVGDDEERLKEVTIKFEGLSGGSD